MQKTFAFENFIMWFSYGENYAQYLTDIPYVEKNVKKKLHISLWFKLFNDRNYWRRHKTGNVALQEHMNTTALFLKECIEDCKLHLK